MNGHIIIHPVSPHTCDTPTQRLPYGTLFLCDECDEYRMVISHWDQWNGNQWRWVSRRKAARMIARERKKNP